VWSDDTGARAAPARNLGFVVQFLNNVPMRPAVENVRLPLVLEVCCPISRARVRSYWNGSRIGDRALAPAGRTLGGQCKGWRWQRAWWTGHSIICDDADRNPGQASSTRSWIYCGRVRTKGGAAVVMVTHDQADGAYGSASDLNQTGVQTKSAAVPAGEAVMSCARRMDVVPAPSTSPVDIATGRRTMHQRRSESRGGVTVVLGTVDIKAGASPPVRLIRPSAHARRRDGVVEVSPNITEAADRGTVDRLRAEAGRGEGIIPVVAN